MVLDPICTSLESTVDRGKTAQIGSRIGDGQERGSPKKALPILACPQALRVCKFEHKRSSRNAKQAVTFELFPHRNVCLSQPYISRELRRLCSGSAQARFIFGSGLLRSAHPYYVTRRSQDLPPQNSSTFNEGPEKALPIARAPKYVTTYTIPTNMEDSKEMLSTPCFKNSVSSRLRNFPLPSSHPSLRSLSYLSRPFFLMSTPNIYVRIYRLLSRQNDIREDYI